MNFCISRLFSDGTLQSYEREQRPMKIMKVLTLLLVMFDFMITHLRCKVKNFSKYLRPPHPKIMLLSCIWDNSYPNLKNPYLPSI